MNIREEFFVILLISFAHCQYQVYGVWIEVWRYKFLSMEIKRNVWRSHSLRNREQNAKRKKNRILSSSVCAWMNMKTKKNPNYLFISHLKLRRKCLFILVFHRFWFLVNTELFGIPYAKEIWWEFGKEKNSAFNFLLISKWSGHRYSMRRNETHWNKNELNFWNDFI